MEYAPTEEEILNCQNMLRNEFMLYDEEKNHQYAERILTISYAIGGAYNIDTLRKIASSLLRNE